MRLGPSIGLQFVMFRLSVRAPEVLFRKGKVGEHKGLSIAILQPTHSFTRVLGQDSCHQPGDLLIGAGGDIDRAWRTGCEQRCPRAVCSHAHPLIEQAFSRPAIGTERGGWLGGAVPRLPLFGGMSQLDSNPSELMPNLSVCANVSDPSSLERNHVRVQKHEQRDERGESQPPQASLSLAEDQPGGKHTDHTH